MSRRVVFLFLVAALALPGVPVLADYPDRPIKVIVPFSAGGGSDTFVRIMQRAIREHELLPQPVVVINVPGAGATIGSRQVKKAHPDGYTLLNLHEGILSAKYSGKVAYGPEAFEPIAGTGGVGLILGVAEDSPFNDLPSILKETAANPDSVLLGANIGAPSHFAARRLEQAVPGAQFRYVQSGGGAKRFAALKGGHIHASIFSISEYVQFAPAGLRALAVMSEERLGALPDLLTAKEQGVDVVSSNIQFWWAPKGTPPERVQVFSDTLKAAMETDSVKAELQRLHVEPVFLSGEALREELAKRDAAVAAVKTGETIALPNLPAWIGGALILLEMVIGVQAYRERKHRLEACVTVPANRTPVVLMSGLTVAFVLIMQYGLLSFAPASVLFLLAAGGLLGARKPSAWVLTVLIAVIIGIGGTWLFTEILVVDLP